MSDRYEEFRTLYRAARAEEFSKPADRRAVRVALTASIAAGVQTGSNQRFRRSCCSHWRQQCGRRSIGYWSQGHRSSALER